MSERRFEPKRSGYTINFSVPERKNEFALQVTESEAHCGCDLCVKLRALPFKGGSYKAKSTWIRQRRSFLLDRLSDEKKSFLSQIFIDEFYCSSFARSSIEYFCTYGRCPNGVSPQRMFALLMFYVYYYVKTDDTRVDILIRLLQLCGLRIGMRYKWSQGWGQKGGWDDDDESMIARYGIPFQTPLVWALDKTPNIAHVLFLDHYEHEVACWIHLQSDTMPLSTFMSVRSELQVLIIRRSVNLSVQWSCYSHGTCCLLAYCYFEQDQLLEALLERAGCDGDGLNLHHPCWQDPMYDGDGLNLHHPSWQDPMYVFPKRKLLVQKHAQVHDYFNGLKLHLNVILTDACFFKKIEHIVCITYNYLLDVKYQKCKTHCYFGLECFFC